MQTWTRRIRGAIGMGLTWAFAWSIAGLIPRWILGFNPDAPFPIIFGVLGFLAGVTFSAILVFAERRRNLDQVSLPRFATWGAAGGILLSAVFAKFASLGWGDVIAVAPLFALASAACASGSLALARHAGTPALRDGRRDADVELAAKSEIVRSRRTR